MLKNLYSVTVEHNIKQQQQQQYLGFLQGGAAKNFLGGAPSKFSEANDSGGGKIFLKKMKFSESKLA